jgi:hypothetical protein
MVSLRVVYQLILIVWFGSLIFIFSHITELGTTHYFKSLTTKIKDVFYDYRNYSIVLVEECESIAVGIKYLAPEKNFYTSENL